MPTARRSRRCCAAHVSARYGTVEGTSGCTGAQGLPRAVSQVFAAAALDATLFVEHKRLTALAKSLIVAGSRTHGGARRGARRLRAGFTGMEGGGAGLRPIGMAGPEAHHLQLAASVARLDKGPFHAAGEDARTLADRESPASGTHRGSARVWASSATRASAK